MDVAQLYMLALRPTMVPIIGEAPIDLGPPFAGQIELESWSWDFHNDEEQQGAGGASTAGATTADATATARDSAEDLQNLTRRFSPRTLDRLRGERSRENVRLRRMVVDPGKRVTAAEFSKLDRLERQIVSMERQQSNLLQEAIRQSRQLAEQVSEAADEAEAAVEDTVAGAAAPGAVGGEESAAEAANNYTFSFSKRLDVSTTQLLNCMKAGDTLPVVTLTMHQASSSTPWTLVVTITKMRLMSYSLTVEPDETMTDMKETWEAQYGSFGYVYQNRPQTGVKSMTSGAVTQVAAKAATQGTVRTFVRKNMFF